MKVLSPNSGTGAGSELRPARFSVFEIQKGSEAAGSAKPTQPDPLQPASEGL